MGWCVVFFKQKTSYEMRISDWSSDVCSSDLTPSRASCPYSASSTAETRCLRSSATSRAACTRCPGARGRGSTWVSGYWSRTEGYVSTYDACTADGHSSEVRCVGHACVSTCRSQLLTQSHHKQTTTRIF